jgi:ABC-type cobalamin/Fe3+-siderophores transport system ATPase subunit
MNTIKYNDQELQFESKNISIVGSNGSGKSSLFKEIQIKNQNCQVISALKNLTISQNIYRGQGENWLDSYSTSFTDGSSSISHFATTNNYIQSDFNHIIEKIFREYTDKIVTNSINGILAGDTSTNLQNALNIWNSIFIDKKIVYYNKKIQVKVVGKENYYDIENLSDGERSVLYIVIKIVLAKENSIIIIDEPETFLNPALLNQLYDECESTRSDCSFVYFSHDLEFVTTRRDNTIFWIKQFTYPEVWTIEKLGNNKIPTELLLKIIGTKKEKILFVESGEGRDSRFYQQIYPDFKIWGVGSCENVINFTKAFNSGTEKFNKDYFGLIDRDFKSEKEVKELKKEKIFCLPVAEYENLFLKKEVIQFIFNHEGLSEFETKFNILESKVKELINSENFKKAYKKYQYQQYFKQNIETIIMNTKFEIDADNIITPAINFTDYDQVLLICNDKSIKGLVKHLDSNWSIWENKILCLFNTDKAKSLRELFLDIIGYIE